MNKKDVKQIIEETFDDVSSLYDINEYFLITAKEMVNDIPYKDNLNILDLSCGTGNVSLNLASKFNTSKVEGIDLSSAMVEISKSKAKEANLTNISFLKADVDNLPYEKKSFDVITCGFGLFFYPDMKNSLKNFLSLLKDDGVFIFSSFTKDAFAPYSEMFMDTLQKDFSLEYPKGDNTFLETNEEINELITSVCNFKYETKEIEISKMITVEQWWETLNSAGYKAMLNQLSPSNLESFKKQHLQDISKLSHNGKIELRTNTLITKIYIGNI